MKIISKEEIVFYEGGPAKIDLIINLLAGITLIGLPFTFGAIVRALWIRFKITDKRISITGGWFGRNQNQVVYSQISEVRSVPRGLGFYGDMVLVLNDGAKLEMKSVPNFRETEKFLLERINIKAKKIPKKESQGFSK
tara:strand:- start:236 stop:649 length:414 start_codon:yes stop_codon:yes gene_type:complete